MTAKKCTKKRDARAKSLFCQSKPIAFLPFLLTSPSSLLKNPNTKTRKHYFIYLFIYLFISACSLKHARDLVRAITKKVKNKLPTSTSLRSQPALLGFGTGHVPLMLSQIKKDR